MDGLDILDIRPHTPLGLSSSSSARIHVSRHPHHQSTTASTTPSLAFSAVLSWCTNVQVEYDDPILICTVHMCNKLASRHVRVRLAEPSAVPRCDICENAPAFFYCGVDGSSLCMQCDMIVHVGGKKTHARNLLLRQRVEFPTNKVGQFEDLGSQVPNGVDNKREVNQAPNDMVPENQQNHRHSPTPVLGSSADGNNHVENNMIDLNMKPHRLRGPNSNRQQQ
ncbi:hypothetical protein V2J09_009526 [Rumex salicifolius]